jgi:hypothetical protein
MNAGEAEQLGGVGLVAALHVVRASVRAVLHVFLHVFLSVPVRLAHADLQVLKFVLIVCLQSFVHFAWAGATMRPTPSTALASVARMLFGIMDPPLVCEWGLPAVPLPGIRPDTSAKLAESRHRSRHI